MQPYLFVVLQTAGIFLFIILALRLFGKKELAQLSVTDLVFILLISNSVQDAMVMTSGVTNSFLGGLFAAGTLFVMNYLIKRISYRSKGFTNLLQGQPVMLIHQGKVLTEHLVKERISVEELLAAAREHGVESLEDVDLAVLEADGNISILVKNYQKKFVKRRKAHKIMSKTT